MMDETPACSSERWREETDEGALVVASRSDPAAFGELYVRYRAPVYRYLRSRTGNEDDAVDLTQQVFLRALERLPSYQARGLPFAAWLFRIARNSAIDFYRRSHRADPKDIVQEMSRMPELDDPEAVALRDESRGMVNIALAQLTHEQRELLALRFGGELTMREIARVVGRTEGSVKKRIARALEALRRQYER